MLANRTKRKPLNTTNILLLNFFYKYLLWQNGTQTKNVMYLLIQVFKLRSLVLLRDG